MSNTVKGYFEPSSTKVHSNIDDLILQAELDKRQFGGVSYYKGRQESPIDMIKYANFMSKANMPKAISELKSDITQEGQETLSDLTQDVISRMKLGDAPMGIIGYMSGYNPNLLGHYSPAKNPLHAPDTIRIFEPPSGIIRQTINNISRDYPTETLLHEPLHGINVADSIHPRGLLFHKKQKGFTTKDFRRYEQNMIQSLSDYFGGREKVFKEAEKIWEPRLDKTRSPIDREAYLRRLNPYNAIEDILNR
tara:strand:+ start:2218 stop:2967 length:750 start_codon:yes stop_codon:yes gene_type:complete